MSSKPYVSASLKRMDAMSREISTLKEQSARFAKTLEAIEESVLFVTEAVKVIVENMDENNREEPFSHNADGDCPYCRVQRDAN